MIWEEWAQRIYESPAGRIEFPEDEDEVRRNYPITYYYFGHQVAPEDYLSNFFTVYIDKENEIAIFRAPDPSVTLLGYN